MILGITGHQRLSISEGWVNIRSDLRALLQAAPTPLVGLSSLAVGADQVFAEELLSCQGELRVVLPFQSYETRLLASARSNFRILLAAAEATITLSGAVSDEEAYLLAGRYVVDNCDELVAIWDGRPAKGLGGTADIVAYARQNGVRVRIIDASAWS
jgi:hypothetical protein